MWLCVLQAALSASHTQLHDNLHSAPWQPTPGAHTPDQLGPAGAAAVDADADPQEVIVIYI